MLLNQRGSARTLSLSSTHFCPMNDKEKPRVLIVDDNPDNLMVAASALAEQGFSLMLARSGAEAIAAADRFMPDAILLDVVMPELDGFETCRRLKNKAQCRDIPVIFLTARNEQEDVLEGFKVGGADFISKPFNREEMLHRVEVHIQRFRLQQQLQKRNEALQEEIELRRKRELQLSISERARVAMRISAGISHHFNNMFQTVLGYSELIEAAAKPDSEIVKQVRRIVAATQKTRQIVNQLANYLGNSNDESADIHLDEVFAEIEVAFAGILPGGVSLTSSISKNCPNLVFNRTDIIQALTNIVMNSVEAMPASGGQINMKASLVHGRNYCRQIENIVVEADYVEIAVVDNGTGMEKAVLDKACEPFFTTAGNFADKNGLGLSVVQGIMHASHGFMSIDSEMGSGTVVRLLFPVSGVA